jgi:glycine dehydrogenase subunit 1
VLEALAAKDLLGGLDLSGSHPELGDAILVCATETKSESDIVAYRDQLELILQQDCAA